MLLKSSVSFYTFRTRDGFGVAQNKRNRNSVLPLWPVEKNNAFVTYSHHTFSRFMVNYVAIVLRTFYSNKQTSQKIRLLGRTPNESDPLLDRKCYVKNCDSKNGMQISSNYYQGISLRFSVFIRLISTVSITEWSKNWNRYLKNSLAFEWFLKVFSDPINEFLFFRWRG